MPSCVWSRVWAATPPSADDLRANDLQLPHQKGETVGDFLRRRVAVAGWAALDDVADKDLVARQVDGLDHFREELAGAADEGQALAIFIGAGPFADENEPRARVALAGHGVGPVGDQFRASGAVGDFGGDAGKGILFARAPLKVGAAEVKQVLSFVVRGCRHREFLTHGVGGAGFRRAGSKRIVRCLRFRCCGTRDGRDAGHRCPAEAGLVFQAEAKRPDDAAELVPPLPAGCALSIGSHRRQVSSRF